MLVVTYVPYNIKLEKSGFKKVASTKNMSTIIVIDSLCANADTLKNHQKRLHKLKAVIDRSLRELRADKRASYLLVKSYLGNISYGDYIDSLSLIKWINKPSQKLLERIKPMGYDEAALIK
jgi:NitT/TauT family transport system substrate-binding protein